MSWLAPSANNDTPVVWRGMMVMKAVQQVSAPLSVGLSRSLTHIAAFRRGLDDNDIGWARRPGRSGR